MLLSYLDGRSCLTRQAASYHYLLPTSAGRGLPTFPHSTGLPRTSNCIILGIMNGTSSYHLHSPELLHGPLDGTLQTVHPWTGTVQS